MTEESSRPQSDKSFAVSENATARAPTPGIQADHNHSGDSHYTINAAESAFLDALHAAGIDYAGPVTADGVLHRFKANGEKNPNGWYVLHGDGIPAGAYGDWKTGTSEHWCAKDNTELTEAERTERDRRFAAIQAEREADRRRQHDAASHQARAILDAAPDATDMFLTIG